MAMDKNPTEKFIKMAHQAIQGISQCPKQFQSDDYAVMTVYGRLEINILNDWIATRFENPAQAKKDLDCNPYSGKWNFHFNNAWDPVEAVESFMNRLKPILIEV